jgi:hypothetical protein
MTDDVRVSVTEYDVSILPQDHEEGYNWSLKVQYRGKGLWGVFIHDRMCLGTDGTWDWEPSPSNREDDWIATHRFTEDEAIKLAREAAKTMTAFTRFGPMTAYDVLERDKEKHDHGTGPEGHL